MRIGKQPGQDDDLNRRQLARGGTKLLLIHEQFPTEEMKDSQEKGWTGCLAKWATLK